MAVFELTNKKEIAFVYEKEGCSGITKIADKVREDFRLVFGKKPEKLTAENGSIPAFSGISIVFGIAGKSPVIDGLAKEGKIDVSGISGKREVYGIFAPAEDQLVIAGSDKRGVIYGLFRISEELGVSPYVNWSNLKPAHKDSVVLGEEVFTVSKEPSVEYRGFFINDEWPAFGTWCNKHFGGFTAKMYEGVFELLLRMKGNYLWPAMWSSCFAEDGPGLASAELADELGVVMGLSHHEPCLRHGEEYKHVRGKDSIYGDAWNFHANTEGITRFWRDGLKRNGHLENVITVGMRGECDSTILGKEATLADNINLLRDVLRTQEKLIKEEVNEDLSKVPRMIALYKEVEAFYYGDKDTPGLREGCPELEDVILMLCEDNQGYLRSLPDEKMRKHPGGFGMYYHFDYHGDPISYEWINSTHLPEVWQQMTTAYEHGVQRLWIVNVGDLGLQELPLSYFLSLAYDYDKWGKCGPQSAAEYLRMWTKKQFGHVLDEKEQEKLTDIIFRAERMIHNRRPEHMRDDIYHPVADYEAERLLSQIEEITGTYTALEKKLSGSTAAALYELVGYSLLGGLNLLKMWILCGKNHYFASIGAVVANTYADQVRECLRMDQELKNRLQKLENWKWDGFAEAPHIGFKQWNMEESANPVLHSVIPVKYRALTAGLLGEPGSTQGCDWSGRLLKMRKFRYEDAKEAEGGFFIANCGEEKVSYEIEVTADWLKCDRTSGELSLQDPYHEIRVTVSKDPKNTEPAKILVKYAYGTIRIEVEPPVGSPEGAAFLERNGCVVMDAAHFAAKKDTENAKLYVVNDLGRREDGVALTPLTARIAQPKDAPYAEYRFVTTQDGDYEVRFQMLPTNTYRHTVPVDLYYSIDDGEIRKVNTIAATRVPGGTYDWAIGVLEHVRIVSEKCALKAGAHTLRYYGTDPENVAERIMIIRESKPAFMPYVRPDSGKSYLGPDESMKCE